MIMRLLNLELDGRGHTSHHIICKRLMLALNVQGTLLYYIEYIETNPNN